MLSDLLHYLLKYYDDINNCSFTLFLVVYFVCKKYVFELFCNNIGYNNSIANTERKFKKLLLESKLNGVN